MGHQGTRPPRLLLAGHAALDFLNSIASPHGEPIEWIEDGADLVDWLVVAGLLGADDARSCLRRLRRDALNRAAQRARHLREWLRALAKRHAGAPLPRLSDAELQPLNSALCRQSLRRRIVPAEQDGRSSGGPPCHVLVTVPDLRSADQLVALVGAEVARFLCEAEFTHVRFCEGHLCTVAFYDRTKNHRRRWCNMAVCGNRAKQARLRRDRSS